MENVSFKKQFCSSFYCILFKGDLSFGDVKLADIPAWIARRDKTPMGIYQGGIRSKLNMIE
jgi:hypothetical protein